MYEVGNWMDMCRNGRWNKQVRVCVVISCAEYSDVIIRCNV